MVLQMARPWKHPKTGVFYLRVRVPSDLVGVAGRSIEKRSLGTKEVAEARIRFSKAMSDLSERWVNLRQGLVRPTFEEMNGFSADFYRTYCDEIETGRWSPFYDGAVGGIIMSYIEKPSDNERRLAFRDALGAKIDGYFANRGIRIDPEMQGAVEFRIAGAIRDALDVRVKRILNNDYSADTAAAKYQSADTAKNPPALKVEDAFEAYASAVKLSPATRKRWLPALRSLAVSCGKTSLTTITEADVNAWIDQLRKDGKAPRTIKDVYLASTKALFRYYVGERKLKHNPTDGFVVRVPKRRTNRGPGLTDDEVQLILDGCLSPAPARMAPCHADARRWVPWLALYSGARVNELTQLRSSDVREIDGIWCLSITPEAGSVKNHKARIVPVHEHLIEQGFPAFVTNCRRSTLFYSATGKSAKAVLTPYKKMGENLASWIRSLGVDDPDVAPNHGFRHRFKTTARRVGMDAEIRDAIQGHAPRTEGEVYGEYPVEVLKRAVDLIPAWSPKVASQPADTGGTRR